MGSTQSIWASPMCRTRTDARSRAILRDERVRERPGQTSRPVEPLPQQAGARRRGIERIRYKPALIGTTTTRRCRTRRTRSPTAPRCGAVTVGAGSLASCNLRHVVDTAPRGRNLAKRQEQRCAGPRPRRPDPDAPIDGARANVPRTPAERLRGGGRTTKTKVRPGPHLSPLGPANLLCQVPRRMTLIAGPCVSTRFPSVRSNTGTQSDSRRTPNRWSVRSATLVRHESNS